MRRGDREVTDRAEMVRIMRDCDVCRLAFNDENVPYIIPLNFGLTEEDGEVTLYFHGATEGTKYLLMEKDPRVSFEMDTRHELMPDYDKKKCTMYFESVIGRGRLTEVDDLDEKEKILHIICDQYYPEGFDFNPTVLTRTRVLKMKVESMTGKSRYLKK